ncbi:hypothetical protein BDB00DRAFT_45153 [Zychaea mexicana]|uniref:uncharacterized protein n=1 Tax=Zychaea mexicana TaxID=64656 RepID=UPI0022FF1786|nr:uncharacterized protein BDB00DRAFT_45153 [Zychaea mexicana]KAI9488421.1 hypothetical protein BDB00DRAFT_45153 [Zychaea mexicana]
MGLILRFLLLLAITRLLLADAVSMTGSRNTAASSTSSKYTHHSIFRAVAMTYQYDSLFAAKEYETYVNTSGMDMAPPVLLHQFGLGSTRHRQQQQQQQQRNDNNQASSSSSLHRASSATATSSSAAITDKSTAATSELLVSGPALAFIVVLTLGAFMF